MYILLFALTMIFNGCISDTIPKVSLITQERIWLSQMELTSSSECMSSSSSYTQMNATTEVLSSSVMFSGWLLGLLGLVGMGFIYFKGLATIKSTGVQSGLAADRARLVYALATQLNSVRINITCVVPGDKQTLYEDNNHVNHGSKSTFVCNYDANELDAMTWNKFARGLIALRCIDEECVLDFMCNGNDKLRESFEFLRNGNINLHTDVSKAHPNPNIEIQRIYNDRIFPTDIHRPKWFDSGHGANMKLTVDNIQDVIKFIESVNKWLCGMGEPKMWDRT